MSPFAKKYRAVIFGGMTTAAFLGHSFSKYSEFLDLLGCACLVVTFFFCIGASSVQYFIQKIARLPLPRWMTLAKWFFSAFIAATLILLLVGLLGELSWPECFAELLIPFLSLMWTYWAVVGSARYFDDPIDDDSESPKEGK